MPSMLELIAAKRRGRAHIPEELASIAAAAAEGRAPDYQLSAWLMAVCLNGMTGPETVALTRAMAASGRSLDLSALPLKAVDKHSSGGVGDGISIALAPLVASAGLTVPMMSGRGLGHTGGTLDKLESIPGFKVRLSVPEVESQLRAIGVCMFGQTEELAPSDRKLYALRDATSTVESLPLIVASILSKKMAEDLDALVLDVKVGSGAIFDSIAQARELAKALVRTAKGLGVPTVGLLTAMDEPLGTAVGNAVEIELAVDILKGAREPADYREVLLALGGWMLKLGGRAATPAEGARILEARIEDGSALERFERLVAAQGGDTRVARDPAAVLPRARLSSEAASPASGFISRIDARKTGEAARLLGAGRMKAEDAVDPAAGLLLLKRSGAPVKKGEPIARLMGSDPAKLEAARALFLSAVEVRPRAPRPRPVILETIR